MQTALFYPSPNFGGDTLRTAHLKLSWMVGVLAVCVIILTAIMLQTGLTLDFSSKGTRTLLLIVAALAIMRYRLRYEAGGKLRIARDFCEYTALFASISLLCVIASYPLAAVSSGFADPALAQIDTLLRFNWTDWYELAVTYPVLQAAGRIAYANIYFSPLLLVIYCACSGDRTRAQFLLVSFWLAGIMTLLLFFAAPAVGPLSYLWQEPIAYMPTSGTYQADLLPLLRSQTFGAIDLGNLQGLVCAPSFHTASAIIYIVVAWSSRILRWPLLALNLAMLLATPVEGTHYLIDMIGGAIVAAAALVLAAFALRLLAARESTAPEQ